MTPESGTTLCYALYDVQPQYAIDYLYLPLVKITSCAAIRSVHNGRNSLQFNVKIILNAKEKMTFASVKQL